MKCVWPRMRLPPSGISSGTSFSSIKCLRFVSAQVEHPIMTALENRVRATRIQPCYKVDSLVANAKFGWEVDSIRGVRMGKTKVKGHWHLPTELRVGDQRVDLIARL